MDLLFKRIWCALNCIYLTSHQNLKLKCCVSFNIFYIMYLILCLYISSNLINVNLCLDDQTLSVLPSYVIIILNCVYNCFCYRSREALLILCFDDQKMIFAIFRRIMINICVSTVFFKVSNLVHNTAITNSMQRYQGTRTYSTSGDCLYLDVCIHCSFNLKKPSELALKLQADEDKGLNGRNCNFSWSRN